MLMATRNKALKLRTDTAVLMSAAGAALTTDLVFTTSLNSVLISSVAGLVLSTQIFPKESAVVSKWFKTIYHHFRWSGLVLSGASVLYLLNFLAAPAQAQFLNKTESWMVGAFPQAQGIAPLIFNAIRALLILFIIFKAIQAVQAARNDEEWQNLVKTPLVIIVLVAITDITVGFITGGGGTPT